MSNITDFLPQYRELNTLFENVVNQGTISYKQQKTIVEFYQQFAEIKAFEKMVLDIVLERDKPTYILLLSGIKTEAENNIQLYKSARGILDNFDILRICKEEANQYNYAIKVQLEATNKYSHELNEVKDSLDAIGFREHTQHEEERLWNQHEYSTKRYNEEREKLASLYNQQKDTEQETAKYIENLFGKICNLSFSFLSIINNYLPVEKENIPIFEPESKESEKAVSAIDPDTIFKTKMYEKFLVLEQKLINDKFLDENKNWIFTSKNRKEPSKQILATFLTGLLENNYFLSGRDSKIQDFFEDRYRIDLKENFQPARRQQNDYSKRYKAIFYDYSEDLYYYFRALNFYGHGNHDDILSLPISFPSNVHGGTGSVGFRTITSRFIYY